MPTQTTSPAPAAAITIAPQQTIAERFLVRGELGRGGMGVTWRATDLQTDEDVALKVLSLQAVKDWKAVELFEREARTLERLDHPGIPTYIDDLQLQTPDGPAFILVQALAPGRSLDGEVGAGWRPTEVQALDAARQLLRILVYLHGHTPPIVHRDIKPANIIRDSDGTLRLVDFGAVQAQLRQATGLGSTVVGTWGYMAPEQVQGRAVPASDLFGVGTTIVHLITGTDPADLPQRRLKLDFRDASSVTPGFARWLDRLIAPMVEDRFTAAAQALAALDQVATSGSFVAPSPLQHANLARPPAGSRVRLQRDAHRLDIQIPGAGLSPASVGILGFSGFWLAFVAFWTFSAIGMGAPIFFPLFSIPFWIVGLGMLSRGLSAAWGKTAITMDHDAFTVERSLLGRKKATRGLTPQLTAISTSPFGGLLHTLGTQPNARTALAGLNSVTLYEGVRKHVIKAPLQPVERRWIAEQLRDFAGVK